MADIVSLPPTAPAASAPAPTAPAHPATIRTQPGGSPGWPVSKDKPGAASGAQRVEVGEQAPAAGEQRPAWLPEKFKSPQDLAQAYQALEQRLGQPAPAPAPTPVAPPPPAADGTPAPQPPAPPASADLVAKMTQEWAATGQVSPQARAEFTQRTGLPDTFIDQQISYLTAQNARVYDAAAKRLGGEGAVSELTEWAKNRLSSDERQAFNQAVYSNNPAMAQMALDGLAARYEAENGRSPRLIAGRKPQAHTGGLVPFQSNEEWSAARKDPKYREDPAYREEVMARMALSSRLGIL